MRNNNNTNSSKTTLIIGLILLLLNSIVDLGVVPYINGSGTQNGALNAVRWIIVIVSKTVLAIGTALIISWITMLIGKIETDYSSLSAKEAISIMKRIVANNDRCFNEYKAEQAEKLYDLNVNTRTNTIYTVDVYKDNGVVCAKTIQSYIERKSKGFSKISTYSDSENLLIESIKISNPNNRNQVKKFDKEKIIQNRTNAFSEDLKYEQYIEIPSEYSELESIIKRIIQKGRHEIWSSIINFTNCVNRRDFLRRNSRTG